MTNLCLMELQESLGRLFEAQFLFDTLKTRCHMRLNDEQSEQLKDFCSTFCRELALRWRRLGYVDPRRFKRYYSDWLRLKVQWPSFVKEASLRSDRKMKQPTLTKLYRFVRRANLRNGDTIDSIRKRNEAAVKMLIRRTKEEIKKKCPLQPGGMQWILV